MPAGRRRTTTHTNQTKEVPKKLKTVTAAALVTATLGLSLSASAQSIGKPEDNIRWRQSAYHTMAWSMGRIKANIDGTYNKDQVIQAAIVIQAIANSGLGSLFPAGTDSGKGHKETRLKSDFFKDTPKVVEVATAFNKEANEMAKVAASGDAAAVKAQFGKLGGACKGCHDAFRKEE